MYWWYVINCLEDHQLKFPVTRPFHSRRTAGFSERQVELISLIRINYFLMRLTNDVPIRSTA
uniref:Uncharacterized protein n=1 Tax=Anguilla anguilla TaxID=7936 RepID=A0A0E9WHE0_ANGAN